LLERGNRATRWKEEGEEAAVEEDLKLFGVDSCSLEVVDFFFFCFGYALPV
jgi:hypothetical protein